MPNPRITVGLPVYQGAAYMPKTLECLQRQTFKDFEAIISVDGNDQDTAEACRPFLDDPRFRMVVHPTRLDWFGNFNWLILLEQPVEAADPRFRMVVHPTRLDWFGNFNWLLQQDLKEFFCFRQHDDTTAPEFFEVLLRAADADPQAAAVYCDCQWEGGRTDVEIAPSIEGNAFERMLQYIEPIPPTVVRGLIRAEAIRQAGLIRSDEFRGLSELTVWLAKLTRWGSFKRVPQALYYRVDHADNLHKQWVTWPEERKRAAWTTMFTGLLEAAMPLCRTPAERLFFQQVILERVIVSRSGRGHLYRPTNEPDDSGKLIAECLERLRHEGNMHLLAVDELPRALQAAFRVDALREENTRLKTELSRLERSRMLCFGRAIRRLIGRPAN